MTVAAMVAAQFREHAIACPRASVRLGVAVMGLGVIARVTVIRVTVIRFAGASTEGVCG